MTRSAFDLVSRHNCVRRLCAAAGLTCPYTHYTIEKLKLLTFFEKFSEKFLKPLDKCEKISIINTVSIC